jgi:hypothetical protein
MKLMIYLFIILLAFSFNANSQNIIDSTTIKLPDLVIVPKFKKTKGASKHLECNPAFIEFKFKKNDDNNLEDELVTILVDTSLAMKILKKYYDYSNFGPEVMIDLSDIKGLGDGDLYSLKYSERDFGMFKVIFESYYCMKGKDNIQVKELIELKNINEKFYKVKDVKVSQVKYIFPAPYIGVNDKLEIDIDSINRHMLNCSSLKLLYDYYYGSGNILNKIPEYVYHRNSNMEKYYSSDILTYPVNQLPLNELADGRGILRNSRIDNNSDNMKQMQTFSSFITSNNIIGDTNYFPINWKTNKQENKIEYIFLGNKLSAIRLSIYYNDKNTSCLWGSEHGESKQVKSKRDNCVDKFISLLDKQYGKSKVLRSIDNKHDIIRVWRKGNCTLSVMYRDFPLQKNITSFTYCDEEYTNRYYQNILKSKNTDYDFINVIWNIYPQPINFVVSRKYK